MISGVAGIGKSLVSGEKVDGIMMTDLASNVLNIAMVAAPLMGPAAPFVMAGCMIGSALLGMAYSEEKAKRAAAEQAKKIDE